MQERFIGAVERRRVDGITNYSISLTGTGMWLVIFFLLALALS